MPTKGSRSTSRRDFLRLAAGGAFLAAGGGAWLLRNHSRERPIPGELLGPSASAGHRLRDGGSMPAPTGEDHVGTVIVGGGVAGLSAAWWLERHGVTDYRVLELEPEVGGNSRSGSNAVSAYPWGAHYLPLPSENARYVRLLLEELKVIRGYENGKPVYDELFLCSDPQERLYYRGSWQDGLVPQDGVPASDHKEYREFFSRMAALRKKRGTDGRPAFMIPLEESSRDPSFRALDRLSMEEWMREQGWSSPRLHWYVNYCCRDDYGRGHSHVSAWAGIHYFAARAGEAANASPQSLLTWPEGNGWLVHRLRERVAPRIRTRSLVHSVANEGNAVVADGLDLATGHGFRVRARHAIFAAPRFVARHVVKGLGGPTGPDHAPWLVANVTLSELPKGRGVPLAWDNVAFEGPSLGYVVATHQNVTLAPTKTVLTYYQPLDHLPPSEARREAAARTHGDWSRLVAAELQRMHPGILPTIERIDAWVWGHGMVTPAVGFLWGEDRAALARPHGRVHFAHTDQSGISIFEEAQYRGVKAAEAVLAGRGA